MIAFPSGARVWLATGHTDMRKGFGSLALMVQEGFKRDPHICVGRGYVAAGPRSRGFLRRARTSPPHNISLSFRFRIFLD